MLIVKLGGSLYNTVELKQWLSALANYSQQQHILIVPGGGPFADQVRTAQSLHHFDDHHAHHMAILAMAQFALLIAGIAPQCQLFHYPKNTDSTPPTFSVWLPDEKLLSIKDLSHSWSVTADSLALWLSQQLNADELIIIKRVEDLSLSLADLVNKHILDTEFEASYRARPIKSRLLHYQDYANFEQYLNKGHVIS
ncbi:MAG: delta 1-pyrroline-5-carboxylate synthetase [Proteobacteria bacterium]|nr:delta 1-pyrroline-5-carboxylate synthetase [Pseudomonadota bacterium]